MANIPVALQMYTVRGDSETDFLGTLRKVAEIGYAGVELAGTGGLSAAELKKALNDLNLKVAGSHVGLDALENRLEESLAYNQEIDNPYVVLPWLPEDRRRSAGDWRRLGETLNRIGAACRDRGMGFCYHNHAFEFERFDGKAGLDLLLEATDPQLVKSEVDTYWVEYGGQSAVDYIRRYAGRVPLIHLKDMANDANRSFAELGQGTMNWDAILPAAREAGAEWFIVEQDTCQRPALESVKMSLDYLKSKGLA